MNKNHDYIIAIFQKGAQTTLISRTSRFTICVHKQFAPASIINLKAHTGKICYFFGYNFILYLICTEIFSNKIVIFRDFPS